MHNATQRVALVTGANRGLGLETSRQLAAAGVTVIMAGRDPEAINAAAAPLRDAGLSVLPTALDVTDAAQIAAVVDLIAADFGQLDILVNNAGITRAPRLLPGAKTPPDRSVGRTLREVAACRIGT